MSDSNNSNDEPPIDPKYKSYTTNSQFFKDILSKPFEDRSEEERHAMSEIRRADRKRKNAERVKYSGMVSKYLHNKYKRDLDATFAAIKEPFNFKYITISCGANVDDPNDSQVVIIFSKFENRNASTANPESDMIIILNISTAGKFVINIVGEEDASFKYRDILNYLREDDILQYFKGIYDDAVHRIKLDMGLPFTRRGGRRSHKKAHKKSRRSHKNKKTLRRRR